MYMESEHSSNRQADGVKLQSITLFDSFGGGKARQRIYVYTCECVFTNR